MLTFDWKKEKDISRVTKTIWLQPHTVSVLFSRPWKNLTGSLLKINENKHTVIYMLLGIGRYFNAML